MLPQDLQQISVSEILEGKISAYKLVAGYSHVTDNRSSVPVWKWQLCGWK